MLNTKVLLKTHSGGLNTIIITNVFHNQLIFI